MAEVETLQLGLRPPKMTILSDRPSQSFVEDLLGLECRLSAVLDILRHSLTKCPITVAIYGDWGTGKTSAMHWLESQLDAWNSTSLDKRQYIQKSNGQMVTAAHPRVHPVWFDPWKYHTREDVWRGIISEVILSLFDVKNLDRQNLVPRMKEAAKKFGAFLGKGFLHALANTELTLKAGATVPGAEGSSEVKLSGEMFRDIYEEFEKANHPEKAYLNQFEDSLKSWVTNFLKDDARIALFIDDLDRCLPEVTLEVLEAIKLYLNIPQIIFVVGLDRSVVDGVVVKHYNDHGLGRDKAEKYLDKIFQVEIQVSPSQTQMADFHRKQIEQLDESSGGYWGNTLADEHRLLLEEGISELARGNPRELKRLLNSALLRGRAATDNTTLKQNTPDALLFAQGVQVFLVHKIVQRRFGIATSLMLTTPVLKWFERWSDLANKNPDFRPSSETPEQAQSLRARGDYNPPTVPTPDAEPKIGTPSQEFAAIAKVPLKGEDGKSLDKQLLFDEELLWKLLQIPFSPEVAQSAPNIELPKVRAEPNLPQAWESVSWSNPTGAFPDVIRVRVAKSLGKSIDELTPSDFLAVSHLNFKESDIQDSDMVHLSKLTALVSINLAQTKITDESLRSLETLTSLRSLMLWDTLISDNGLTAIAKLVGLEKLDLAFTVITDKGLKTFDKLNALQSLGLWGTAITDSGLTHLKKLPSLESLSLGSTQITDIGVKTLMSFAKLNDVDLSNTPISDAGLQFLLNLTALQCLRLNSTSVTDNGLRHLATLPSLRVLELSDTPVTDATLRLLGDLKSLRSLKFAGTKVTDKGVAFLGKLETLESLELDRTKITNNGLESLQALRSLSNLSISGTPITDAGLGFLGTLSGLQFLDLDGTGITDNAIPCLSKLAGLHLISVLGTGLTQTGIDQLKKTLPNALVLSSAIPVV